MTAKKKNTSIDYLCKTKCIFEGRIHCLGKVYTYPADKEIPYHLESIGEHKEILKPEDEIRQLKKIISTLRAEATEFV